MEKFLICSNCSSPIGFPHQPLCLTKSLSVPNVWKKTEYDDKFITFGMNFSFDDIFSPGCRKNILSQIASSCLKQCQVQGREKTALPSVTKSWPGRWIRNKNKKHEIAFKANWHKKARAVCHNVHAPLWKPSIWTPQVNEVQRQQINEPCSNFVCQPEGCN